MRDFDNEAHFIIKSERMLMRISSARSAAIASIAPESKAQLMLIMKEVQRRVRPSLEIDPNPGPARHDDDSERGNQCIAATKGPDNPIHAAPTFI